MVINRDFQLVASLSLPQFASSPSANEIPPVADWWSDEMACEFYKRLVNLTAQCSRVHVSKASSERMDMAHLNEYLILGLLSIAAENEYGNVTWQ